MATICVLLLLVNLLLISAKPTGKAIRHRHMRELDSEICKKRLLNVPVTISQCSPIRERRFASMSLEKGQLTSLCQYVLCPDIDETRVPRVIERVYCREQGCGCKKRGSYKCTQLMKNVEVRYGDRNETLRVEHACACAVERTRDAEVWLGPTLVP